MKYIDSRIISFFLLTLFLVVSVSPVSSAATDNTIQSADKDSNSYDISKASVQAKIDAITNRPGLDEAVKTKVLNLYHAAEDNLNALEEYKARTSRYQETSKTAPEDIKKFQKEDDPLPIKTDKARSDYFEKIAVDELDQRLVIEKGKISSFDQQIKQLENEIATQQNRPPQIREETVLAQQEVDAATKKMDMPTGASPEAKLEAEAQQIYSKTLVDTRLANLKMLEAESLTNPVRVELLKAKLQWLDNQKKALNPVIADLEAHLNERKQREARDMQNALTQAEKATEGKDPLIQARTTQNIQYSRDLQSINSKTEQYAEQKAKIDAKAQEIEADFKSAEKKISLAGLSPTLGKILREQRRNLTSRDAFEEQSEAIQNETALTSLRQFDVEDRLKKLADIDSVLKEDMKQVSQNVAKDQRMKVQVELRDLLNDQKEVLNKLSSSYSTYLRTLGDFDFSHRQMVIQAEKFAQYLDERLLWVPSSEPINLHYVVGLYKAMRWILSPSHWANLISETVDNAVQNPFLSFITVVGVVLLQFCRHWARRQLIAITDRDEKIYTDNFRNTTKALSYSLIIALAWPVAVHYIGWIINGTASSSEFNKAMGEGLQAVALPLFFIKFFYLIFSPYGIARKHFQWQAHTAELLRKQLRWLQIVTVPGVFLVNATSVTKIATYSDSLGRLALLILVLAMMVFLTRLLRPTNGLLQGYITHEPEGWIARFRYVWFGAAIIIPLTIIGFAVAGYYLSALELQQKLIITLRLIFFLVIFHELVIRWLTLVNRQLALKNARQRRKAAAALHDKVAAAIAGAGGDDPILPIDEQQLDIPKINAQTIRIVNVIIGFSLIAGGWLIWKNILPAFSFLDNIELWQYVVKKGAQESYQSVTLTNLLLAGFYLFIAVVSVRNFSGVMEILVFRRLSVEAGGRYAINQLAKYVLISIGFISVANELGGSWAQVQWLVAALSVGLGFGLQEIFANLVSGIILLFERPIRVGDTVTIGDVSGKVSRIQMRATTLIDFDQKELIVPNKTFITSQLVNWTLTDATTRIVIPISIAYGSDVEFAHSVLLKTIKDSPLILSEPAPSVIFMGFGESALNFSIRIYVGELSNRLAATHDLHVRLEKALREHDIAIPFAQRDVHIRSFVKDLGCSPAAHSVEQR